MLKKLGVFLVLCGSLYAADTNNWVGTYVTNKVTAALTPYSITVCLMLKYHVGTNEVSVADIEPGDNVVAIMDIPLDRIETNATNIVYSANVVGYVKFFIPALHRLLALSLNNGLCMP